MKLYCILTFENIENTGMTFSWEKSLYLFKDAAFKRAKEIGENACVIELQQTASWNHDQMLAEEF